jgi:hypothetical protein
LKRVLVNGTVSFVVVVVACPRADVFAKTVNRSASRAVAHARGVSV